MWYDDNLVIKMIGGSRAYNLNRPDSDFDLRGVAIAPLLWLLGFSPRNDADYTYTVNDGTQDCVIHTLEKYCRLALANNPNILETLFCRDEEVVYNTNVGQELRDMRKLFLSRLCYASMSRYAFDQIKRMRVVNSSSRHGMHAELVAKYGFDTKNGMHVIRLLTMAKELFLTGELRIYRSDEDREFFLGILNGKYTLYQLTTMAEELDAECAILREQSPLPETPDYLAINSWLTETQRKFVCQGPSYLEVTKNAAMCT